MNAKQILYDFQMAKFKVFKAQDPESKQFDVVFDFNGKKLYANKCTLFSLSPTFDSMLSERWTKPKEPIIITNYSYDDFKEFLTFIYSGECQFTNDNIFSMVDMAEFYGIPVLKEVCGEFLANMEMNIDNVYQMLEFAEKYSIIKFKKTIYDFVSNNLSQFLKSEHFLGLEKSTIKEIVESNCQTQLQEELYEMVYKWAENKAMKKKETDSNVYLDEAINENLYDILPFMSYDLMSEQFIIKFIVKKSFLFSENQLSDILWSRSKTFVRIVNGNGKQLKGKIQCDQIGVIINEIESQKNTCAKPHRNYYYWRTSRSKPATPKKLIENEDIEWYLVLDNANDLALKKRNELYGDDYLLAEMFAEEGFEHDNYCKIEIV